MSSSSIVRSVARAPSPRVSYRAVMGAVLLAAATAGSAAAQTETPKVRRWDFLISSGTVIPTGDQRAALKRGNLTAAQLSYALRPALALNATVGWARSRDLALDGDPKLDLFIYDVGAEMRGGTAVLGSGFSAAPFAGVGGGIRSYDHRGRPGDATHLAAAYASAGGEVGKGRVRVRVELRDYLTRPIDSANGSAIRNDVALLAGIRLTRRPS